MNKVTIGDNLVSQHDATKRSWNRFQSNRTKEWGLYGCDTGHHSLNMLIGGWIPGKVTTIGARSGVGKTALVSQMASGAGRVLNGKRAEILFCSWEMESSYLIDRHICHGTGITNKMLNQGAKLIGDNKLEEIKKIYNEAKGLPVTYQEMSTSLSTVKAYVFDFVKKCVEKSEKEGIDIQPVIIIDYIQMANFEGSGLRTYGIGDFMNGIKQTANETGAAFCVFAQIKRTADDKDMPERNDFADSQSIEMASDNLILLHRPEYNNIPVMMDPTTQTEIDSTNKMLIRVLKGRDYGIGDILINCEIKYFRFWSLDHDDYNFPYWELYSEKEFWLNHFGLNNL